MGRKSKQSKQIATKKASSAIADNGGFTLDGDETMQNAMGISSPRLAVRRPVHAIPCSTTAYHKKSKTSSKRRRINTENGDHIVSLGHPISLPSSSSSTPDASAPTTTNTTSSLFHRYIFYTKDDSSADDGSRTLCVANLMHDPLTRAVERDDADGSALPRHIETDIFGLSGNNEYTGIIESIRRKKKSTTLPAHYRFIDDRNIIHNSVDMFSDVVTQAIQPLSSGSSCCMGTAATELHHVVLDTAGHCDDLMNNISSTSEPVSSTAVPTSTTARSLPAVDRYIRDHLRKHHLIERVQHFRKVELNKWMKQYDKAKERERVMQQVLKNKEDDDGWIKVVGTGQAPISAGDYLDKYSGGDSVDGGSAKKRGGHQGGAMLLYGFQRADQQKQTLQMLRDRFEMDRRKIERLKQGRMSGLLLDNDGSS